MTRQILHIDMDAFYASVEQRDDPALRGIPVVVGGDSRRGVVAAASYEARVFGLRSAMPMVEALRRCPHVRVVPPRMAHYVAISREVFRIMRTFTPLVEGLSLDEAFLDVTESRALFGSGEAIARQIKEAIHESTGLTASAGVATSKFAAKIASPMNKPDGLTLVGEDVAAFLEPLPIERMWGIGPKAAAKLHQAGFSTIGDLSRSSLHRLQALMGDSWGAHVHALARGIDERPVVVDRPGVTLGAEETFERDITGVDDIRRHLLSQSGRVARRLMHSEQSGRTVSLKIKTADFKVRSRSVTLTEPVADTDSIYQAACQLLERMGLDGARVRLTGVSVGKLGPLTAMRPTSLFAEASDEETARRRRIEEVSVAVRNKFGAHGLTRATLLGTKERLSAERDDAASPGGVASKAPRPERDEAAED